MQWWSAAASTGSPAATSTGFGGTSCTAKLTQTWKLVDQGEAMPLDQVLTFKLEGDPVDCNDVDNAIKAKGTNGKGLDGCTIRLHVDTSFSQSDG